MNLICDIKKRQVGLIFILLSGILLLSLASCKKYLDKKPIQRLAVPNTLTDLQALLDNETQVGASPGDLEFVADNYYMTSQSWATDPSVNERLTYIWDKDAQVSTSLVWSSPYFVIYEANLVLSQLSNIAIDESNKLTYNNVKGTALFYRSFQFHQLAQLFCPPYSNSASTEPGIVLRLVPEVTAISVRSTVQQTYDQIISDLKTAALLLPSTSLFPTRPSKATAYAELARVYLSMRDYTNAGKYADSCLSIYNSLLDYNKLNLSTPPGTSAFPIYSSNPEILYISYLGSEPDIPRDAHQEFIDSSLYQSYDVNDIRKTAFFGANSGANTGTYYWRGCYFNYSLSTAVFDGLATDEIYLIRAECSARAGNAAAAMVDLNTLMRNRWKTGTYTDATATDANDALNKVLRERRKELLFRGLRWSDLRRFNLEGANITLKRIINGATYTLPPNDPRWVLLIPDVEVQRSGLSQNPR